MNFKNIDAYFFDLDGTLIDSQLDFLAMRRDLGIDLETDILNYVDSLEGEALENAYEIIHFHEKEGAKKSSLIKGVPELLTFLEQEQIPFGILTRNSRACSEFMLEKHRLNIPLTITREDAPPKPKPDGLLKLCKHFNVKADKCIYVGDYIHDIKSAKNAKMKSALYLNDKNHLFIQEACHSFKCFTEFLTQIRSDISR